MMMKRAMVLAAGLALLGAPQASAQEEQEGQAEMQQRAPRAQMRQHAQRGEMRQHAQSGEMRQSGPGMGLMLDQAVGRLMDRRYELNLTDGQMSALGDLREEAQSVLTPLRDQMILIRDGVEDGSMTRENARTAMQGLHEQGSGSMEALHNQLGEILDADQQKMAHRGMARHGSRRSRGHSQRGRMMRSGGQQGMPKS